MMVPVLAGKRAGVVAAMFALWVAAGCTSSTSPAQAGATACRDYHDAFAAYEGSCHAPFQDQSRFVQSCEILAAAPGASGFAAALDACASVVKGATATCGPTDVGGCATPPTGTLANGAPCGENFQCQTGYCKGSGLSESVTGSGVTTTVTCGVCAPRVAVGQPCDAQADACVDGASCSLGLSGSGGDVCTAIPQSDVGGSCAGSARCKSGLHCDFAKSTCAAPVAAGGACTNRSDCATSLVCLDGTCAPAKAAGEACSGDVCAGSLSCDGAPGTCKALVYAEPGSPCNDVDTFCRVGICNLDAARTAGTCPTVVADGQPCTQPMTGTTCDDSAYCIGGKCQIFDPATCK